MIKKFALLSVFLFLILLLPAQNYNYSNEIKVFNVGGKSLPSAWSGAMEAPQFGTMDLDGDGKKDIIIYERTDWQFNPYLNRSSTGESKYEYAPKYKTLFDSCFCDAWALFVDYNCDGKEDIICGTKTSNVRVFTQISNSQGEPEFRHDYKNGFFEVLYSQYSFGSSELFSTITDIPAIVDTDFDGDIDFLTFSNASNYIELHKNLAIETLGRCDTLVLSNETACWGHFSENSFDNTAVLHDTLNGGCNLNGFVPNFRTPGPGNVRHAGSTLLALDLNGNNLIDMLLGDISYKDVYALYNNAGSQTHAYIDSVELHFPQYDLPINLTSFPGMFYIDSNNDGIKDLVLAPNQKDGTENYHSVQVYENINTNNSPNFHFKGKGFVQDDCIELGSTTSAAFFDYNNDGKKDFIAGNFGYFNPSDDKYYPSISLFLNTGTLDVPQYNMDTTFLAQILDSIPVTLKNIYPAFGDLDGDNDVDLLLGNALGTLYYFENTGGSGTANFEVASYKYQLIDVGLNSAPFLYDIDTDNDLDLFIGNEAGRIWFYRNNGSPQAAVFDTVTTAWGKLKIGVGASPGNAKPFIIDYDNDGASELLVGTKDGVIQVYENLPNNAADSLTYSEILFGRDFGSYSSVTAAVIDSTHALSYLIGDLKGGFVLYKKPLTPGSVGITHSNTPIFTLYPNPANQSVTVDLSENKGNIVNINIINPLGQVVFSNSFLSGRVEINIETLEAGIYFIRAEAQTGVEVKRLIIQHKH